MPQSHTELYYHIVWSTRGREPLLTAVILATVVKAIQTKSKEVGAATHAVNGVEDHIHLAVRLPASLAVAEYVERVKGYASWLVNHSEHFEQTLYWQSGYGALTFRKAELPTVVAYIRRQQEHHAARTVWIDYERSGAEVDGG
jgi:putative transposase